MSAYTDFCEKNSLNPETVFEIAIGQENGIVPGKAWCPYFVVVGEKSAVFHMAKGGDAVVEVPYLHFESAAFGVGSASLWLQCHVKGQFLPFRASKKQWKSPAAKAFLAKLKEYITIVDEKEYDRLTGPLSVIWQIIRA